MEKISDAILDKVRVEAQDIIKEAETRAGERLARAKEQQETRLTEGKNKLLSEAGEEATRILAQSTISARQELLLAKTGVIDEITSGVRKALSATSVDAGSPWGLIGEAIDALDADKAIIYVSPKDISAVRKLIAGDKKLADRITEVKELDTTGGVIIEAVDGTIRIDNSYDTRLEMLLPRLLPEIGKELFQGL